MARLLQLANHHLRQNAEGDEVDVEATPARTYGGPSIRSARVLRLCTVATSASCGIRLLAEEMAKTANEVKEA